MDNNGNDTDIVTRLRGAASESYGCQCVKCEAADEIERLRRKLLAEENAYDIERRENEHLQTDRNNLLLRAEEAERMLGLYREWIGDEMLSAARKKAGL